MKTYLYAISRRDIPLSQQAIQAAHSGIQYARIYSLETSPSYIHLTVKNQRQLEHLRARLNLAGIRTAEFHEPYQDWGLTAISCLLTEADRHHLRGLQLWKLPTQTV